DWRTIFAWQFIECHIQLVDIPRLSTVDEAWSRHPTILDQLVELRRRNPEIHCGFGPRKAASRHRARLRRGEHLDGDATTLATGRMRADFGNPGGTIAHAAASAGS